MTAKQAANFSKLRRGMVFWYDPNPEIDKENVPPKVVNDRPVKDFTMYGERPYVVVSSDEVCRQARVVQVCPIGTKDKDKDIYPYDVVYNSNSKTGQSAIRCEQIRTVNSDELSRYECMLDDDIMDRVAEKLKLLLGISECELEVETPVIAMSAEEVEDLIDAKMIESKNEATSLIDAAVSRILNGVSSVLNTRTATRPIEPIKPEVKVKKKIVVGSLKK